VGLAPEHAALRSSCEQYSESVSRIGEQRSDACRRSSRSPVGAGRSAGLRPPHAPGRGFEEDLRFAYGVP
jgi:hypothetical protein